MANHSRNVTRKKIGLVAFVLCAVCSAVLVGRLFYLQIVDGDRYKQLALNQQLKDTVIEPHRGSIYDTNMKTLATSKTVWDVVFEPANLSSKEEKRGSGAEGPVRPGDRAAFPDRRHRRNNP